MNFDGRGFVDFWGVFWEFKGAISGVYRSSFGVLRGDLFVNFDGRGLWILGGDFENPEVGS